jgi:hypothetical protein
MYYIIRSGVPRTSMVVGYPPCGPSQGAKGPNHLLQDEKWSL